jgi:mRNA interferase RelE/StbE
LANFKVLISETAIKQLNKLEDSIKTRIKKHLHVLSEDPFKRKSGADIKKLKDFSNPALFRLRISDFRIIYTVQEKTVKITEIFRRRKGYKWLE